jgi:hypothetical protein
MLGLALLVAVVFELNPSNREIAPDNPPRDVTSAGV